MIFFLSSRRRHTMSKRDWSSDVCSSDLGPCSPTERTVGELPSFSCPPSGSLSEFNQHFLDMSINLVKCLLKTHTVFDVPASTLAWRKEKDLITSRLQRVQVSIPNRDVARHNRIEHGLSAASSLVLDV